jgi:ABC-2 type transport system permease protein
MRRHLRGELIKIMTTRTTVMFATGLLGLVVLAAAIHLLGFPVDELTDGASQQRVLIDVSINLGTAIAAIAGSTAATSEFRHGTIRPTLLADPRRQRMFTSKLIAHTGIGVLLGVTATATALVCGIGFLSARNIPETFGAGDAVQLVVGGSIAAGLWALIGVGVGAIARSQAPVTIGLLAWMLFIENLLRGSGVWAARFSPGSLAQALSGRTDNALDSSLTAGVLLAAIAAVVAFAGARTFERYDVA